MDIHLPVDNTDIDSGYEAIQAKKKADVGKAAASRLRAIREEETPKKGMRPSMKLRKLFLWAQVLKSKMKRSRL